MGKWLAAATVTMGLSAGPAAADASDTARFFAGCVGRLSAQIEFQWLMSDPASDETAARRDEMLALLEAVAAPDQGCAIMAWRVNAQAAHAALLRRAHFNEDPADAAWALAEARRAGTACTGLLLG